MQSAIRAGLAAGLVAWGLTGAARAENPLGGAIQKLHLSPQQLLSVRDFLGPFGRGIEIEASGEATFVLRDDTSMAYAGEFSLRTESDGSVVIDRVNGPAALDAGHMVTVPLRLDRKSRAEVVGVLAGFHAADAATIPAEELPALKLVDPKAQGTIWQARAVFLRDGSGSVRSIRAVASGIGSPSLNVIDRYFSPIQSDGTKVWRAVIVEVNAALPIGLANLESRYACSAGSSCKQQHALVPVAGVHLIKWTRQLVASVPPQLLAQIAPPLAPPPAPPIVAAAPNPGPAAPAPQPQPAAPVQNNDNF
jgi:hypothetical protein